jgi:hypothetical protein
MQPWHCWCFVGPLSSCLSGRGCATLLGVVLLGSVGAAGDLMVGMRHPTTSSHRCSEMKAACCKLVDG